MEFGVLGPLEVRAHGRALDLGAPKQRALLGALLLQANRVVPRARLVDLLWEDDPPETAHKALQLYVSRLRKLIGRERLVTKAPGYLVAVGDDELDLARFGRLRDEGRFEEALSLWRGPALADLASHRFAKAEIARLEELRLACLEERIEQTWRPGGTPSSSGSSRRWSTEHPLRERLRGQLMLCLYRCGASGGGARGLPDGTMGVGRGARHRARPPAARAPAGDPRAGPDARARRGGRVAGRGVPWRVRRPRAPSSTSSSPASRTRSPGAGACSCSSASRASARAASPRSSCAVRASAGARVLVGRCWEAGGAPAYWPWVQSLRAYVRESRRRPRCARSSEPAPRELAQILPELRERFPDLPEPPHARLRGSALPPVRRDRRSSSATLREPADPARPRRSPRRRRAVAAALQFLARELGSTRMLVLGAYRDVDPIPGQPLTETLAELAREPVTRRLALGGLSEREVAEYVELTASRDRLARARRRRCYEETEGNPLFVGEIVRLLAVEGVGPSPTGRGRSPSRRASATSSPAGSPTSREECNRVLVLASVLGREFALDALARMAAVSEDELLDTLDEAMAARVVSDVPGRRGRLRFAHVLIRDTLYEGLTTARRVRLHRLAVEALEALYGDEPGPHLAELAHHAIAGSDFDKGLRYARRAGDRALALLAYEEAARLYETALDALDLAAPARRADALRAAALARRGARFARGAVRPRSRPSSRPPASRAASACRASSPARRPATAGGSSGRGPGTTTGSCRCSRRGSPRSPTTTSSSGPGSWPGSPGRFATSTREIAATR